MQELTSRDIQNCCIDMLTYFDAYAKENNIVYYMAGGTLLGAVRHQGFIPWDDDVDLMIPRTDYERLINDFDGKGRYEIISCETNDNYCTPFARIWDKGTVVLNKNISPKVVTIGVFLDLFPIDGFPKNAIISKLYVNYLKLCRTKLNSSVRIAFRPEEKYKTIKKVLKYVWRKNGNFYARKHNNMARKYSFENSKYVGVTTTTAHLYRERNLKEDVFSGVVYLPFEHLLLPAPSGYDIYLRHLYGDYMRLPPKEQQHSAHEYVVRKIT